MEQSKPTLNLVVQAALKLDARTPAWRNTLAFIQSCYGTRVREYELVGCASAEAFEAWPDTLASVAGLKPTQLLDPWIFAAAS